MINKIENGSNSTYKSGVFTGYVATLQRTRFSVNTYTSNPHKPHQFFQERLVALDSPSADKMKFAIKGHRFQNGRPQDKQHTVTEGQYFR